jgi:hypothetical protein
MHHVCAEMGGALRKLHFMAHKSEDMGELHRLWCMNFTLLALVMQ